MNSAESSVVSKLRVKFKCGPIHNGNQTKPMNPTLQVLHVTQLPQND